jgi:hypothetical protein
MTEVDEKSNALLHITLRCALATIVAAEKQYSLHIVSVYVCVCVALVIQHAMRMRHIFNCCLLRSTIFFHIISYTAWFSRKNLLNRMCFDFPYKFVRNISHSMKNWKQYDQKCVLVFMQSTRYSCQSLMKLEFSRRFFEIMLKYHISWKSVQWEPTFSIWTDGQTGGRTDLPKLTVSFRILRTNIKMSVIKSNDEIEVIM